VPVGLLVRIVLIYLGFSTTIGRYLGRGQSYLCEVVDATLPL